MKDYTAKELRRIINNTRNKVIRNLAFHMLRELIESKF